MRLRELRKLVEQLSSGAPATSHILSEEDILLPQTSHGAPVLVGGLDVPSGLYQGSILMEFDPPDQGDGSPPTILARLTSVELYDQDHGNVDWSFFLGDIAPTRIMDSDLIYIPDGGTLQLFLYTENSAVSGVASPVPVTVDKIILTLLG